MAYPIVPVPAVSAVLQNNRGEVLLTKRSAKVWEPGKWCVPGGHLDGGDSWLSAVKREVKEETGLKIFDPQLLGLYSDPELTLSQYLIKDKYYAHYVVMAFLITRYEGTLRLNDEVVEFRWASPDRLPQPIFRANEVQIQDAVRFKGKVVVR